MIEIVNIPWVMTLLKMNGTKLPQKDKLDIARSLGVGLISDEGSNFQLIFTLSSAICFINLFQQ